MANEFLQAQKKQRYLILILALVICSIVAVIWFGFFQAPAPVVQVLSPAMVHSDIDINWDVLEDAKLEALKSFEQIPAIKDEIGRENPFIPYK
ncbi:MAG: hypothetical protein ABH841_01680 [Candidatus Nealsonbacteria bacterium]